MSKVRKLLKFEDPESESFIQVDQRVYEKLTKKVNILDMRVQDGKLSIKYTAKGITGEATLNDITNLK